MFIHTLEDTTNTAQGVATLHAYGNLKEGHFLVSIDETTKSESTEP